MPLYPPPTTKASRNDRAEQVIAAYPVARLAASDRAETMAIWGATSGMPIAELERLQKEPWFRDRCKDELIKAQADGTALEALSNLAMLDLVQAIRKALTGDDLDVTEKAELSKVLQRIKDGADKRRAAAGDDRPQLIIDVRDLPGIAEALQKPAVSAVPMAEVIDMPETIDAPEPKFGSTTVPVSAGAGSNEPRIVLEGVTYGT